MQEIISKKKKNYLIDVVSYHKAFHLPLVGVPNQISKTGIKIIAYLTCHSFSISIIGSRGTCTHVWVEDDG